MARVVVTTGDRFEVDGSKELIVDHINTRMKHGVTMIAFDFTDANRNPDIIYVNGYNILTVID